MEYQRYIAFDVETPNHANDRMSAIGVAVVEGERVTETYDLLVDPEVPFEPFNVALTGITPQMVAGQPTFPEAWERLRPIFESGLLVAHNAQFDMSVLAKCLRDYGIFWREQVPYACTCQMSRRLLPGLPNHRLNTLCDHLGIELDHHRAGSDSEACGRILLHHLEAGAAVTPFLRTYDLMKARTVKAGR
nr:3'-5' exonuclease [Intestinimonas timonensis]